MAEYRNSFWSRGSLDPQVYKTEARPQEYRGYLIYHRIQCCWDVVKDGRTVGQYAGQSGAKRFIDMLHGEGDPELVAFHKERTAEVLAPSMNDSFGIKS